MKAVPRFTEFPLPEYRYLPGKGPKDEKRKDIAAVKIKALPPESWAGNEAYLYGADLFHHGYYYEAHEVWEELWHKVGHQTLAGSFLKALIQMAAVQLKLLSGDSKTAGRMTLRVRVLLEQVQSSIHPGKIFMGLSLPSLLKKIPDSGAPMKQGLRLDLKF